jgi:tRNA(Ile)-lysidine synthase
MQGDDLSEALTQPLDLLGRLQPVIFSHCSLDAQRPVLVGFSGGPDSLCMLHVLWQSGLNLIVAHLDHQLRPESADEAQSVTELAEGWGLPVIIERQDVKEFSERQAMSIEEAARMVRYRFLFSEAKHRGAQAVAVGHTADDQVETVLMHLLRGSGTSGLRGMAYRSLPSSWSQDIPLVRPLLGTWRADINAYLEANHLTPFQDPTNLDVRYYRNYLRQELIPDLEKTHPRIKERIWRTADVLREDYAVLETMLAQAGEQTLLLRGEGYVVLDRRIFLAQAPGIQRGLIRRAVDLVRPGLRDFDFEMTQAALDFARSPSRSGKRDLAAGIGLFLEGDGLWLVARETDISSAAVSGHRLPSISPGSELRIELPGIFPLEGNWRLAVVWVDDLQAVIRDALANTDPYVAWLDAARLQFPLVVRARRRGDRFHPLGLEGHSLKLSDFMINVKIPRRARDSWPLVISNREIAWVPGYRLAETFRVTPASRAVIRLSLEHSEE